MYCASCGAKNDDDAAFCERCGSDLRGAPRPAGAPTPAAAPQAPAVVYAPTRTRAWWYPIGVWVILSAFVLFVDFMEGGGLAWAWWVIGILGIFMVGFPLLRLLEERSMKRRGGPRR